MVLTIQAIPWNRHCFRGGHCLWIVWVTLPNKLVTKKRMDLKWVVIMNKTNYK